MTGKGGSYTLLIMTGKEIIIIGKIENTTGNMFRVLLPCAFLWYNYINFYDLRIKGKNKDEKISN